LKTYYPICVFSLIFIFISCEETSKEEPKIEKKHYSNYYSINQMKENAHLYGFDSSKVEKAIVFGMFKPNNIECSKEIIIDGYLNFGWFNLKKDLDTVPEIALKNITTSLFKLFGDPTIPEEENYDLISLNIEQVLDSVKKGSWSPQCGGISKISCLILSSYSKDIICGVEEIDYPEHTLNFIRFNSDGLEYILFVDIQNGFVYPYNKTEEKFYSLNEIKNTKNPDEFDFWWVSNENKKRNFVAEILPCNLLEDSSSTYYASKKQGYTFERLSYSFHKYLWFDLNSIDISLLKEELYSEIIDMIQGSLE